MAAGFQPGLVPAWCFLSILGYSITLQLSCLVLWNKELMLFVGLGGSNLSGLCLPSS
jgi:hypothetical protein